MEFMKYVACLFTLLFGASLSAATLKIYVAETPPLLEKKGEGVAGLAGVFGKTFIKKYRVGFLNGSMRESELKKIFGETILNLRGSLKI